MSTPVNSGVVWLGFLIERVDGRTFGYAGIALLTPDGSPPLGVGLNYAYIYYGLDNDTGEQGGEALTAVRPGKGKVDWLVARLDFNAGTETLYVNPVKNSAGTLSAEGTAQLRMIPSFQGAGFNQVLVHDGYVEGNYVIDEVRIGDTFTEIRTGK